MTPEERRKNIMYQIDDYHDRRYRNPDNPTFMPAAFWLVVGTIATGLAIAWWVA